MLTIKYFTKTAAALLLAVLLYGCGSADYSRPPMVRQKISPTQPETETTGPAATEEKPGPAESALDTAPGSAAESGQSQKIREISFDYAGIEFIQHRLIVYENKYDRWLKIAESELQGAQAEELTSLVPVCIQKLERVISGYNNVLEELQHPENVAVFDDLEPADDFTQMQRLDISFLESRCNELLAIDIGPHIEAGGQVEPGNSFSDLEDSIAVQMSIGNYQEVLLRYNRLVADFPGRQPSLEIRLDYGRALQYTGQLEEAAKHYKGMLTSGDLDFEPLNIQRKIGDLFLAAADFQTAELYYNSLILDYQSVTAEKTWAQEQLAFMQSVDPESEEMLGYIKLLREFQTYDYREHHVLLNDMINSFAQENAGSPAAVSALRLKAFAMEHLKSWFGSQLVKIDALVAEKKFSKANELLNKLSGYSLPADLEIVLQKTSFDVTRAEMYEQENQQLRQEEELTDQWDSALQLLDSQQYDAAISAFTALMGTEYAEQAKMKITEAADQAAGEMRKEAASLFIKAGKTPDMEYKKSLLVDSYKLLSDILVKYPQTGLLEKVRQNIAILEEQIERLDPTLLEELHRVNSAEFSTDSTEPEPYLFR